MDKVRSTGNRTVIIVGHCVKADIVLFALFNVNTARISVLETLIFK